MLKDAATPGGTRPGPLLDSEAVFPGRFLPGVLGAPLRLAPGHGAGDLLGPLGQAGDRCLVELRDSPSS